MKFQVMLLGLLVASSIGLVTLMYSKRTLEIQLNKTSYFEQVKYQVSSEVLKEFRGETAEVSGKLEQAKIQVDKLYIEVKGIQENSQKSTVELQTCNSDLKRIQDEASVATSEKKNSASEFQKQKKSLTLQLGNLKKQLEEESQVCKYIDKSSDGTTLCPLKELEKDAPKEVKEKQEGGKEEAPKEAKEKQEGGKEEAPKEAKEKQEGGKEEAPKEVKEKQEGGKEEAPKEAKGKQGENKEAPKEEKDKKEGENKQEPK